jgi:hypothetical protein
MRVFIFVIVTLTADATSETGDKGAESGRDKLHPTSTQLRQMLEDGDLTLFLAL